MTVEARVSLRRTEVLILGNPKTGRPLRQATKAIGIALQLKTLARQGEEARTWLFYNRLGHRHGMDSSVDMLDDTIRTMAAISAAAASGGCKP
jgi:hypothetical protein